MNYIFIGALVVIICVAVFFSKKKMAQKTNEIQPFPSQNNVEVEAASTNDVPRGVRAFMSGRYKEAFLILEPAAHDDNLRAQQLLAKMYFAGNGVDADKEQYVYWLKRAAANGDKPSKIKVKKMEAGS